MGDEKEKPPDVQETPATRETEIKPRRSFLRRRWPWVLLGVLVVLPATVFALWSWFSLSWTYSEGDRAGYVQKFSRKGWVCKTWEGELSMVNIPGQAQERWLFSVRDDSIAEVIRKNMGNRVSLVYEEKRGIPTSCFGETNYFVTGVRPVP